MFLDFYQMRQQPFGVTPDPAYLYPSATHREALAALSSGIKEGRGFAALLAPPGMGKTTLLYQLLEELHDSARTVFLFQTQCDSRELFQYLLNELRIESSGLDVVTMHARLNEVLFAEMIAGRRFVLVVDEAQNLSDSVLETVRMLSNFETSHTKLLQIVLAGQPQLGERLARPDFAQLRQRIAVRCRLQPFSAVETGRYIDHRLKVARYGGESLFDTEALALIAKWSEGIPRNINNLCYNALEIACAKGLRTVGRRIVLEALAKLEIVPLGCEALEDLVAEPLASESTFEMAAEPPVLEAASKTKTEPVLIEAEPEPQRTANACDVADESAMEPVASEAVRETVTEPVEVASGLIAWEAQPELEAEPVLMEAMKELGPEPIELEAGPESEIAANACDVADESALEPVASEAALEEVTEPVEVASAQVASDGDSELVEEPVLMEAITEFEIRPIEQECDAESVIAPIAHEGDDELATQPVATETASEMTMEPQPEPVAPESASELKMAPIAGDAVDEPANEPVAPEVVSRLETEPIVQEAEIEAAMAAFGWDALDDLASELAGSECEGETEPEIELVMIEAATDLETEPIAIEAATDPEMEPIWAEAVSRMEREIGAPAANAYAAPEAAEVPEPAKQAVGVLPLTYGMPTRSHVPRWDFRAVALTGVFFLGIMLIPAILKFTTPGQARAESLAKQSARKPVVSPTVSPEHSGGYSADPEQVGTDQVITVAAMPQQTLKDISILYVGRFDAQLQSEISALNPGLTDPDHLTPGQLIRLPLPPGSFKKGGEISTQE